MNPTTQVTKAKIAALRGRLVSVAKAADLLAMAEELKVLGAELAREEAAASGARFTWPGDVNAPTGATTRWGKDAAEDPHG